MAVGGSVAAAEGGKVSGTGVTVRAGVEVGAVGGAGGVVGTILGETHAASVSSPIKPSAERIVWMNEYSGQRIAEREAHEKQRQFKSELYLLFDA
jgi:hypothetical protein